LIFSALTRLAAAVSILDLRIYDIPKKDTDETHRRHRRKLHRNDELRSLTAA